MFNEDEYKISEIYYTTAEISKALKLSQETIQNYIRAGKLKGIKIGRKYRVAKNDYDDFVGIGGKKIEET